MSPLQGLRIFGRGRALDALIGKGINADTIAEAAKFLCGACSCQVKRLNPGVDLLIAANWDTILNAEDAAQPSRKGERVPIPTPKQQTAAASHESNPQTATAFVLSVVAGAALLLAGVCALVWRTRVRKQEERTT